MHQRLWKRTRKKEKSFKASWNSIPYKTRNSLHLFWGCNVLWPHKKHTQECYGTLYCSFYCMNESYEIIGYFYSHIYTQMYCPLLDDYNIIPHAQYVKCMFLTFRLEWEYRPAFLWNVIFWLLQTILNVRDHFWHFQHILVWRRSRGRFGWVWWRMTQTDGSKCNEFLQS